MAISFKHAQLTNGLTVVAETDSEAHTAAVGFFVKTGARDETTELMGVSHFLEHMMFKGTARRTADDVNREFDELGADYNAFTSHEQTVYYAHVLPEFLSRATDLLGDMLRPSLRRKDFDMEKKVILEEIGMYDDRPEWRLQDALLEDFFGAHPLGHRVLGTTQTVGALTAGQMREYFEARYSPDNIVVAAAGRLDFVALRDQIEQLCGGWSATDAARDTSVVACGAGGRTVVDAKQSRHYVGLLCPGPSAQDPRRYAARVLADVLGDHEGSRLYWELVDPGLAEEADFSFMPQDGCGAFMGYASCDPARATVVEDALVGVLDGVAARRDLRLDELERAVNKLATSATLQGERPAGRMHGLGTQWTYQGAYTPLDEELERLRAVTVDDVASLLRDFPLSPRRVLRMGPDLAAGR